MEHAKVGDVIKIVNNNHGSWVQVGCEYVVESVSEGCPPEKVYDLKGVNSSWCGEPCHFEIISSVESAAETHPKYDTFQVGNTVRRWRDVEEWEWQGIGEVELPELGVDVDVARVTVDLTDREDMFYSEDTGWNYPMRAFVLAEYYNHTITNRGTAELNNNSYGKSKSTSSIGKSIEVQRPTPSIISGKRNSGSGVQGRGDGAITRGGHTRHKAITGK
jgi:hypothetical protein